MPSDKNSSNNEDFKQDQSNEAENSEYSTQEYLEKKLLDEQSKEINKQPTDSPILQRVAKILTNSKPEDWRTGGAELTIETRIPQPMPNYEFVYIRDIKDKSLILKCSIPVSCHYSPGGYCPTPISSPQFSVEIRDIVFDADKLVNPKFANNFKGKFLEVVATGEVAQKLFVIIHNLVKGSSKNSQREFEDASIAIYDSLPDKLQNREITDWSRSVEVKDGKETTTFTSQLDKFEVKVQKIVEGWEVNFQVKISSNKMSFKRAGGTPKIIYLEIEQMEQENQILKLEEKLVDLGLADDEF